MTRIRTSAVIISIVALGACNSGSSDHAAAGGTTATGGKPTGGTTAAGGAAAGGGSGSGGAAAGGIAGAGGAATGGNPAAGGVSGSGGAATGGKSSGTGGSGNSTGGAGGKSAGGNTGAATGGGGAAGGVGAGGTKAGDAGSGDAGDGGVGSGGAPGGAGGGGGTATGGSGGACGYPENTGACCEASAGALKKNTKLPDPFAMHDGKRISAKAEWACRRNEIKKDLEKYEIGTKPEPPTVEASYASNKLSVKVSTSSGTMTITSTVSGSGDCVVIGMNGASSLVSGCTQVPFMHDQVVGYNSGGGTQNQSDPFYKVYPSAFGKVGNYNAWSWGISRLIDGIVQMKDQMKVDPGKIAVHGCSYAGKMALFGGALDERVALTIAQESGGGGITSWRTSQDFATRTKVNVEKIDNTNYAWFLSSMKSLDPYSLPHDHHELIAMVAPRAIIALGNPGYEWLGDESGYKSVMAAVQVFTAMGVADHIGYDFTGGHNHCAAAASQQASVKTFVDKYLKGGTGASDVAIKPSASNYDLDYTKAIDWTAPTLQ